MADPRWRLFWHHDVIFTWCDVIIPRDIDKKIDYWTYYILCKFHCNCLNILEVTGGGGGGRGRNPPRRVWKDPKNPALDTVKHPQYQPSFFSSQVFISYSVFSTSPRFYFERNLARRNNMTWHSSSTLCKSGSPFVLKECSIYISENVLNPQL